MKSKLNSIRSTIYIYIYLESKIQLQLFHAFRAAKTRASRERREDVRGTV